MAFGFTAEHEDIYSVIRKGDIPDSMFSISDALAIAGIPQAAFDEIMMGDLTDTSVGNS